MTGASARRRGLRILVTGAAGFIGSHLCERLLAEGHGVWGLDAFDPELQRNAKRRNLAAALTSPGMHVVEGDVRDAVLLEGLLTQVPFHLVIHLAALTDGRTSIVQPEAFWSVNVTGTLRLLEALRRHHVSRLIFASSAAVYGRRSPDAGAFRETDATGAPISPYGASKRAAELLCHTWHRQWGLSVHCLRLFEVFGPRQRHDQPVETYARQVRNGEEVVVYGERDAVLDYAYVDDIVEGIARSAAALQVVPSGEPAFEVLNLGGGRGRTAADLIDALAAAFGTSPRVTYRSERTGNLSFSLADLRHAEATLGYRPRVGLEDGVARYAAWLSMRDVDVEASATVPASR